MKRSIWLLTIVPLLVAGVALAAGGDDLSWHAISGGGGHSSGGDFTLDGGVVQPAGMVQGGNCESQAGFGYGLDAVPPLSADVDGDCDVDIVDIMLVAIRWGSVVGDAKYSPRYDRDGDGDIDITDVMLVASHWSESCATAGTLAIQPLPERAKSESSDHAVSSGPALRIEPESSTVQPGDVFTVEVLVDGLTDLGGFEFTLAFNADVLAVEAVEPGPLLGSTGRDAQALPSAIDNGTGSLRLAAFSLGAAPGAAGEGVVAHIHLRAVAAGSGSLIFRAGQLTDTAGQPAAGLGAGEAVVIVSDNIPAPPLPTDTATPQDLQQGVPLPTREGP